MRGFADAVAEARIRTACIGNRAGVRARKWRSRKRSRVNPQRGARFGVRGSGKRLGRACLHSTIGRYGERVGRARV